MKDGQLLISGRAIAGSTLTLALLAGFIASVAMVLAFAIAFAAALVLGRLPVQPLARHWQRPPEPPAAAAEKASCSGRWIPFWVRASVPTG